MNVQKYTNDQLDMYMETTIHGFTEEQIGHMAWYLGVRHEEILRLKDLMEKQGDNMTETQ